MEKQIDSLLKVKSNVPFKFMVVKVGDTYSYRLVYDNQYVGTDEYYTFVDVRRCNVPELESRLCLYLRGDNSHKDHKVFVLGEEDYSIVNHWKEMLTFFHDRLNSLQEKYGPLTNVNFTNNEQ